jgi:AraC family transcriptional regulator
MQKQSTLFIKGMVCDRCVMFITNELKDLGYTPHHVALGQVHLLNEKNEINITQVEERLAPLGFSLLEDRKVKIVREVKELVEEVYSGNFDFPDNFRFSELVKQRWNKDYDTVSDVFIAMERKSLEQYIIEHRICKVKELLVYSQDTLADIAFKLNFNSVSHLSAQFKQYTGLTPSHFKEIKRKKAEVIFSSN